ncbi:stage V sporulation protein AC [Scatolibacter rhodanostii]|uniref:stage V sporulation protein AC n=1 Tax=Scatolibacter rhodanostii TaxID=2014781 RepID=UPI00241EDFF4|nr:stage V sporulation protein AC [Scatolibacter rhodanostii]
MKITSKEQYGEMVKLESPNSNYFKNSLMAFLFGGSICTLGEFFCQLYLSWDMELKESRTLVAITLIFIAAVLTVLKVYDKVAKYAGAGIVVPITGFANSVVASAIEFRSEGFVMGLGAKIFSIAGPVLVFGISSSVLYGIILYVIKLVQGG